MTVALTLLVTGILLVALLTYLLFRSDPAGHDSSQRSVGSISPLAPRLEDCDDQVLDRIFGTEDSTFIRSTTSKQVQRLFFQERKELAFCWLSQIRSRTTAAMQVHVAGAGKLNDLQPMLEIGLAVNYFVIQAKCGFIAVVLLLQGPSALRSMVARAGALSNQARDLVEIVLRTNVLSEKTRTR